MRLPRPFWYAHPRDLALGINFSLIDYMAIVSLIFFSVGIELLPKGEQTDD